MIDLYKIYENYLHDAVKNNPKKYINAEALEKDMGVLTDKWEATEFAELDGLTPKEFIKNLADKKLLFDYIEDCLETGIEVCDIACFEALKQEHVEDFLRRLLFSDIKDAKMLGAVLLREKGGEKAVDIFLEIIMSDRFTDEIKNIAFDFLAEDNPNVVDKILLKINDADNNTQELLVQIMAEYKGRKEVFYWLVTMLYRAENVALYAKLLGQYDDEKAIEILKNFSTEYDINYVEFVEIRNAIERLGGEFDMKKDFSEDELYKYLHGQN